MKKIILTAILLLFAAKANAAGIGVIDYSKVVANYPLAKNYKQQIDKKYDSYKNYVISQENAVIKAKTEEEKKAIEKTAVKEITRQQKEYIALKNSKENEIQKNIEVATEKIRLEKNLDIILKKDFTVTGGIDCTKEVINRLK